MSFLANSIRKIYRRDDHGMMVGAGRVCLPPVSFQRKVNSAFFHAFFFLALEGFGLDNEDAFMLN